MRWCPWLVFLALIVPHYPKIGRRRAGRPRWPLELIATGPLLLQHWYALSESDGGKRCLTEQRGDAPALRDRAGMTAFLKSHLLNFRPPAGAGTSWTEAIFAVECHLT